MVETGRPLSAAAERRLRRYVREHRSDPRSHLVLAEHFLARGFETAAVQRYSLAQRVDEDAKHDPRMLANLVHLASRPTTSAQAAALLRDIYGEAGLAAVDARLASGELDEEHRARLRASRAVVAAPP